MMDNTQTVEPMKIVGSFTDSADHIFGTMMEITLVEYNGTMFERLLDGDEVRWRQLRSEDEVSPKLKTELENAFQSQ